MHPWPTFVLIVLVLGFTAAIAEIIVDTIRQGRPSRRNRVRQRGAEPVEGRLVAHGRPPNEFRKFRIGSPSSSSLLAG
jgi:hypothetical protein